MNSIAKRLIRLNPALSKSTKLKVDKQVVQLNIKLPTIELYPKTGKYELTKSKFLTKFNLLKILHRFVS